MGDSGGMRRPDGRTFTRGRLPPSSFRSMTSHPPVEIGPRLLLLGRFLLGKFPKSCRDRSLDRSASQGPKTPGFNNPARHVPITSRDNRMPQGTAPPTGPSEPDGRRRRDHRLRLRCETRRPAGARRPGCSLSAVITGDLRRPATGCPPMTSLGPAAAGHGRPRSRRAAGNPPLRPSREHGAQPFLDQRPQRRPLGPSHLTGLPQESIGNVHGRLHAARHTHGAIFPYAFTL